MPPCYLRRRRPALARQPRSSRIYPEFGLPRLVGRELCITRAFPCVARGFKARGSFRFKGCCWRRSLAIDGYSGTSRGHDSAARSIEGTGRDLPLFRPDISQVGADRASVMRCRRSLPLAVGRCCCCHRCCQLGADRRVASRPAPCRGWPASGPGRLLPGPWLLTGVFAEAPWSSVTSRVRSPGIFTCARCPAVTVALEAGGADTYTQRAIPGSEASQGPCAFPADS
jgi:hypothetical protein